MNDGSKQISLGQPFQERPLKTLELLHMPLKFATWAPRGSHVFVVIPSVKSYPGWSNSDRQVTWE